MKTNQENFCQRILKYCKFGNHWSSVITHSTFCFNFCFSPKHQVNVDEILFQDSMCGDSLCNKEGNSPETCSVCPQVYYTPFLCFHTQFVGSPRPAVQTTSASISPTSINKLFDTISNLIYDTTISTLGSREWVLFQEVATVVTRIRRTV